jgi:hypothetical protein
VSSRARRKPFRVGEHLPVDDVGQSPFEAAHGFHRSLAGGQFSPLVGAAFGVTAKLNHSHDVQDAVDAPVAGA